LLLPSIALAQPKPGAETPKPGPPMDAGYGTAAANVAKPDPSAKPRLPEAQLADLVSRGVVGVYVQGKRVALGAVLHGDGRVLTALSALGGASDVELRRADGSRAPAKVLHRDANVDLALLVPQSGVRREGFLASEADPASVPLTVPRPAASGKPAQADAFALARQVFKKKGPGRNASGIPLTDLVQFSDAATATELPLPGAPLVDGGGSVIGIAIPACDSEKTASCTKIAAAAGIGAIRNFLRSAPASAVPPAGWLGIVGAASSEGRVYGVRVVAVAPQGPAERGGLLAGTDLVVAVEGHPVDSPEGLGASIAGHAPGEVVKLLVFAQNTYREVAVTLRAAP
jgi:serine protease Do